MVTCCIEHKVAFVWKQPRRMIALCWGDSCLVRVVSTIGHGGIAIRGFGLRVSYVFPTKNIASMMKKLAIKVENTRNAPL